MSRNRFNVNNRSAELAQARVRRDSACAEHQTSPSQMVWEQGSKSRALRKLSQPI
jgi:hypothetical protein